MTTDANSTFASRRGFLRFLASSPAAYAAPGCCNVKIRNCLTVSRRVASFV